MMVQRNQNVDQVLRYVQQNNFAGQNNITNMVDFFLPKMALMWDSTNQILYLLCENMFDSRSYPRDGNSQSLPSSLETLTSR